MKYGKVLFSLNIDLQENGILRNDLEYLRSGNQSKSSKFYDQLEGNKNKVLETIIK